MRHAPDTGRHYLQQGILLWLLLAFCASLAEAPAPRDTLPADLEIAARRMLLVRPGANAFHIEARFTYLTELGARGEGTFTEDWWSEAWWKQTIALNGRSVETRAVQGKILHKQEDGFTLPFVVQALLNSAMSPFPSRKVGASLPVETARANGVTLRCTPVPGAALPVSRLAPELQNFCIDDHGDLRATANSRYRVTYNDVAPFGARFVARDVRLSTGSHPAGSFRVVELRDLPGELDAVRDAALDEQIDFALAPRHPVLMLTPRQMQRQMLSSDVHMVAASPDVPLKPNQAFAEVRVLQADGRLLDAEVLNSSDAATRALALRVLQHVSFSNHAWQNRPLTLEGAVLLVVPQ